MILFFCFGGESMAYFLETEFSFGESLASSGIGFLIVFIGLICLIALVSLMGAVCQRVLSDGTKTAKPAPVAPAKKAAPVQTPAPAAIENRDELVAIFSAAVAEELGTDVSAIRVVSLKQIG